MKTALALIGCGALVVAGGAGSAVRKNWIPAKVERRIEGKYPALAYGPTWLRPGVRFVGYDLGSKKSPGWGATFDAPHHGDTTRWLSWEVAPVPPSECTNMTGYAEATFTINGVKVYWWAANGEETASRCITGTGPTFAITAGASVQSDEQLNTRKRRHHAYLLAKAVACAARFPAR